MKFMQLNCRLKRIFKCVETDAVLCQLNYQVNWDLIEDWNQCFYLCHVFYTVRMKTRNFVPLGFFSCIAPLKVCPRRQQFCATCYRIFRAYFSILSAVTGVWGRGEWVYFSSVFPALFSGFIFLGSWTFSRVNHPRHIFPPTGVLFFPALFHFTCFLSFWKDLKPLKQSLSSFVCLLIFAAYIRGRRRQFTFKFDQATGDSS